MAAVASVLMLPRQGRAQAAWPSRPVRVIGGGAPGGPVEAVARILGRALEEILGQPFIVESRPGAGGYIAAESVARAPPDGYTLNIATVATHGIGPSVHARLPIDPVRDFIHIARLVVFPNIIYAGRSAPFRDLPGLLAYARANPGVINHGSTGIGTTTQLAGVMLARAAGIEIVHVPFRGTAPLLTAVLAGDVQVGIDNLPGVLGQVRAGAVVPLAVTTAERSPDLPLVPSVRESGIEGYDVSSWFGLQLPAGTPAPIAERLAAVVQQVLERPDIQERYRQLGALPAFLGPAQFDAFVRAEIAGWAPIVRAAGLAPE